MPSVQHTAALAGFRPVAKALGARVGETYRRGIGWSARADSSRTMRCIAGCSSSVTGRARMARIAILSLFQYETPVRTSEISRPMNRAPEVCPKSR